MSNIKAFELSQRRRQGERLEGAVTLRYRLLWLISLMWNCLKFLAYIRLLHASVSSIMLFLIEMLALPLLLHWDNFLSSKKAARILSSRKLSRIPKTESSFFHSNQHEFHVRTLNTLYWDDLLRCILLDCIVSSLRKGARTLWLWGSGVAHYLSCPRHWK